MVAVPIPFLSGCGIVYSKQSLSGLVLPNLWKRNGSPIDKAQKREADIPKGGEDQQED